MGIVDPLADKTDSMDVSDAGAQPANSKRYLIDTMSLKAPNPNMEIQSYVKDGLVDDWDAFERVLDYTFTKHLKCDPSKHPILFTEPAV